MENCKFKMRYPGIDLASLVFIVFLVLKLAEIGPVASWSWWWVTSPMWGPLAIVALILVVGGLLAGLVLAGAWVFDLIQDWCSRGK